MCLQRHLMTQTLSNRVGHGNFSPLLLTPPGIWLWTTASSYISSLSLPQRCSFKSTFCLSSRYFHRPEWPPTHGEDSIPRACPSGFRPVLSAWTRDLFPLSAVRPVRTMGHSFLNVEFGPSPCLVGRPLLTDHVASLHR